MTRFKLLLHCARAIRRDNPWNTIRESVRMADVEIDVADWLPEQMEA